MSQQTFGRLGRGLLLPLVCGSLYGCARGVPLPDASSRFTAERKAVAVELDRLGQLGYPVIDVTVGNVTGRFCVDTGGRDINVISPRFFEQIKRHPGNRVLSHARVKAVDIDKRAPLVVVDRVRIGDHLFIEQITAVVLGFENMEKASGGHSLDGALTLDALAGLEIDIDPQANTVTFRKASEPLSVEDSIDLPRPPSRDQDPRPYTWLEVEGRRFPVLLDTCMYPSIELPKNLVEPNPFDLGAEESVMVSIPNRAKREKLLTRGKVIEGRLGEIQLRKPRVDINHLQQDTAGVVGAAFLNHYRVIYNTETKRLQLVGPRELHGTGADSRIYQSLYGE